MGREVRRVPSGWVHPEGRSLHDGFGKSLEKWKEQKRQWDAGMREDWGKWDPEHPDVRYWKARSEDELGMPFEEWWGEEPNPADYMPDWPESERTHYQLYETTSEGSPISPVMDSPESLARWLTDNNASAFANMGATYDQWLRVCGGTPSGGLLVDMSNGTMRPLI